MAVQRKRVVRATDAILRGEDPGRAAGVLIDAKWLERRNGNLAFGPACGDIVGLSVNRESLEWVVAGVGELLAAGQLDADVLPIRGEPASPSELQQHLTSAFAAAAPHLPHGRVAGVGIAWPAPIAPNGEPRDYPFHHAGLRSRQTEPSLPLTPIVRRALAAAKIGDEETETAPDIAVINDADADMLFEMRYGVARGAANAMGLKICGGLGTALVHDGRLVRGGSGAAGEIEHIRVRLSEAENLTWEKLVALEDLPPCPCTGRECVGRFATGGAIIDQLANYFDGEELTPNERGRRIEAEPMSPVISDVCGRAGGLLGQALLGPVLAFDPELLVVTSFPHSDALVDAIRTKLTKGTAVYLKGEKIVAGTPDRPTSAIGAAQLAIEQSVVPRIDREVPYGRPSTQRRDLPAWLRQRIPAAVEDVHDHAPDYGTAVGPGA